MGQRFARVAHHDQARVDGTTRSADKASALKDADILPLVGASAAEMLKDARRATHWLVSAAPDDNGQDPFLAATSALAQLSAPQWIGYLSSTSVYGDTGGEWVDEYTPPAPTAPRGERRVIAEQAWLDYGERNGIPTQVFRLGGIYGPGRSALDRVMAGTASVIIKPEKLFNRIHVDDIVRVLLASMGRPRPGAIYNVVDGKPLPPEAVTLEAYRLLDREPPASIAWDDPSVRPTVRAFYEGNVRVRSALLGMELGVTLTYKDALAGLQAIYKDAMP